MASSSSLGACISRAVVASWRMVDLPKMRCLCSSLRPQDRAVLVGVSSGLLLESAVAGSEESEPLHNQPMMVTGSSKSQECMVGNIGKVWMSMHLGTHRTHA